MKNNEENPYFQMADMWIKSDPHHTADAKLSRVVNEPADPPMRRSDGLIWLGILLISSALSVAAVVWLYKLIFS